MGDYNNSNIIESDFGSFQDSKFMDYVHNWQDNEIVEKKRIKIINSTLDNIESEVNSYIQKNARNIKIIDIKYQKTSVMILYELINNK